jgi:hypothetical protein
MDSTTNELDAQIAEKVLEDYSTRFPLGTDRNLCAFDRKRGQFVLLREGWQENRHRHFTLIHIELRDGKFWIHRDGTEYGIANDLVEAGIPKQRIVLAFQHPYRRERGEFAVS